MTENNQNDSEKSHGTRFNRIVERAQRFYRMYTAGLKPGDFKRLFTKDIKGFYLHFGSEEKKKSAGGRLRNAFSSFGRIFWGFLLALAPARRIIYGIAFIVFLFSSFIILTAPYGAEIRQDVTTLALYAFIIASFLLALELADKLSARDEIEIAREVQLSLLPPDNTNLPGLHIATFNAPATEVGGDYYDFALVDGLSCLAIGDVSGHGLASGLLMAMAKSAWQTQLLNDASPRKVLSTLNTVIRDVGNARTLMTFLYCRFDPSRGVMTFSNAGHIYPLLLQAANGKLRWLETPPAYPLGVKDSLEYQSNDIKLDDGDILFFLSDGIVEAINSEGDSFGYHRFEQAAGKHKQSDPNKILEGLLDDFQQFIGEAVRIDDMTIIVVRYSPEAGTNQATK